MAGAHDCKKFVGRNVRERFLKRASQSSELRAWSDAQDGFAEAEDAVRGGLQTLGRGVSCAASNNNLDGMARKQRGGEAIRCGE